MSHPLAVGDRVWVILKTPPTKGGARTVVGTASARVVEELGGEVVALIVERSSEGASSVGRRLEEPRWSLYAQASPEEHAAFGVEVRRLWAREAA